MSLDSYAALDVSVESDLRSRLLKESDVELRQPEIKLTATDGQQPPNLTPGMASWFADNIQPLRREALAHISSVFEKVEAEETNHGAGSIFLERRIEEIDKHNRTQAQDAKKSFYARGDNEHQKLQSAKVDYETSNREYQQRRTALGREPKLTNWGYWVVLAVIILPEMVINYDTLLSLSFISVPALALAAAALMAAALFWAAHLHGTLLKQYAVLADPSLRKREKSALKQFLLGACLLATVLLVVAYARNYMFQDVMVRCEMLGTGCPSRLYLIGGSLMLNLMIYGLGAVVAYLWHDSDPRFVDSFKSREQKEKAYQKIYKKVMTPHLEEISRINSDAEQKREAAHGHAQSLKHLDSYKAARSELEKFKQQDAQVIGALSAYRRVFVQGDDSRSHVFLQPQPEDGSLKKLNAQEYQGVELSLNYI